MATYFAFSFSANSTKTGNFIFLLHTTHGLGVIPFLYAAKKGSITSFWKVALKSLICRFILRNSAVFFTISTASGSSKSIKKTPSTAIPLCFNRKAATDESTPPLIAMTTFSDIASIKSILVFLGFKQGRINSRLSKIDGQVVILKSFLIKFFHEWNKT